MRWKEVPGFPKYQVSDTGQVRGPRAGQLKLVVNSRGYVVITLHRPGRQLVARVHRLVAEAFCNGKTFEKNQVNHIDCDKQNNSYKNLEWCTPLHNTREARLHGLIWVHRGENHPFAQLKNHEVRLIRQMLESGNYLQSEIAELFNIAPQTVSRINTRKIYKYA